jgi:hypothetical protein
MSAPKDPGSDLVHSAAGKVVDELSPEVGRFMGTILGSASIQFDGVLGDRVAWWRFRQAVRLARKAKDLCDAEGLEPGAVPLRVAVPLLEKGSLADEEDLSDRYAALLANAATAAHPVSASFAQVLSELEPGAARLLDEVFDRDMRIAPELRAEFSIRTEAEQAALGMKRDEYQTSLDDLVRLGLLRSTPGAPSELEDDVYRYVSLTAFGRSFVTACRGPGEPQPAVEFSDREALEREAIETEVVETALERLTHAVHRNGNVRKALVDYVVRRGRARELAAVSKDAPYAIPLRDLGRYLAASGEYEAAFDVASVIRNLQERTNLAYRVISDIASAKDPRLGLATPPGLQELLRDIYREIKEPQRLMLREAAAAASIKVDWPSSAQRR